MKRNNLTLISLLCIALSLSACAKNDTTTATAEPKKTNTTVVEESETLPAEADAVYGITDASGNITKAYIGEVQIKDTADIASTMPVSMQITYKLDGKEISAGELRGKSGHLVIDFKYKNQTSKDSLIPFMVVSGTILDKDIFSNLKISEGKIIDDGARYLVVGYALPGIKDYLNIQDTDLINEDFSIEADVKDYDLDSVYTLISNDLLADLDIDSVDDLSKLGSSFNELGDAMTKLLNGASDLYNGIVKVDNGLASAQNGAKQLNNGLNTLSSSSQSLRDGSKQVFNSLLKTATSELQNNQDLTNAGVSVPDLTIENYNSVLNGILANFDADNITAKVREQVEAQVEQQLQANIATINAGAETAVRSEVEKNVRAQIRQAAHDEVYDAKNNAQFEEAVKQAISNSNDFNTSITTLVDEQLKEKILTGVLAQTNHTREEYEAMPQDQKQTIDTEVETQINAYKAGTQYSTDIDNAKKQALANPSADLQNKIDEEVTKAKEAKVEEVVNNKEADVPNLVDAYMQSEQGQATLKAAQQQAYETTKQQYVNSAMANNQTAIEQAIAKASGGAKAINALKAQLDSYKTFYDGLNQYTAGVDSANKGSGDLLNGINELKSGSKQLKEGSSTLVNGLKEFDSQGIEKLIDAFGGDSGALLSRLKDLDIAARDYHYSYGNTSFNDGVKFIFRTAMD